MKRIFEKHPIYIYISQEEILSGKYTNGYMNQFSESDFDSGGSVEYADCVKILKRFAAWFSNKEGEGVAETA